MAPASIEQQPPREAVPAAGTAVAVVDDDASVRNGLARFLRSAGLAVETFECARTLLASRTPGDPACLIVDLRMPEMSGIDLRRALASSGDAPPMVFVTAHGLDDLPSDALEGVEVLMKPVDGDVLLAAIVRAISRNPV